MITVEEVKTAYTTIKNYCKQRSFCGQDDVMGVCPLIDLCYRISETPAYWDELEESSI